MIRKILAALLVLMLLCGSAFADYRQLSVGSQDKNGEWNVYSLQLKLQELGYLSGSVDGVYGNGTASAVKSFQRDYGLEVTGVADPITQEVLFSLDAGTAEPDESIGAEASANANAPKQQEEEEDLTKNDTYIVQHNLVIWGYLTDEPDGIYGERTREALKTFQKENYDAMVAYTDSKIKEEAAATPAPTAEPAVDHSGYDMEVIEDVPVSAINTDGRITDEWMDYILNGHEPVYNVAFEDDKNSDVRKMQNRLVSLGYLPAGNDGYFGAHTKVALKYFQRLNGLEETGDLDRATIDVLFTGKAVPSDKYVTMYKLMVSVTDQRVYVYKWTGEDYTALVHTFVCSTGMEATPTILGTFQAPGRNGEWYWMEESNVWVKYAFVIEGGYFFHSVLYPTQDGAPTATSVKKLGTRASHGCIRLSAEDAEWIYNNCASGTTVVIYDDAN